MKKGKNNNCKFNIGMIFYCCNHYPCKNFIVLSKDAQTKNTCGFHTERNGGYL